MSSIPNESTAALPPTLTIFRRRSLSESSVTAPTRAHPAVRAGSVVRRTWAMEVRSGSCAQAWETETSSTARNIALAIRSSPIGDALYACRVTGPAGLLRIGEDLDPADRPQRAISIGRAAIFLAALPQGGERLLTPLGSAAIKDHPDAAVAFERVGQGVIAPGKVPGHDEQRRAAWSRVRAMRGPRRDEDRHGHKHRMRSSKIPRFAIAVRLVPPPA